MDASSPARTRVGLIGVGLLGSVIAERLLAGGFAVVGYDLVPAQLVSLRALGGETAPDAGAVFRSCERIILSLPAHEQVQGVLREYTEDLRPGTVILDTTTGDPSAAEALAPELALRGITYLDATISGSSAQTRAGTAVLMVGGEKAGFAACADLFSRLGRQSFHTGGPGTGAKMKLATNVVLGLNRVALAEGLAFAVGIGIDPAQALAVMQAGPAYSKIMDAKGPKMLRGEFSPEARLAQHLKDVRLILRWGDLAGLPMPLSKAHQAILEAAEAAGLGELDNSAVYQLLQPAAVSDRQP